MYVSLSTARMVELGLLKAVQADVNGWRVLTTDVSAHAFFDQEERRDGMSHCSSAQMQLSHVCRCTSSVVGK
jgi:hypothetical protein